MRKRIILIYMILFFKILNAGIFPTTMIAFAHFLIFIILVTIITIFVLYLNSILRKRKIEKEDKSVVEINEERWRFALEGSDCGVFDWNVETGFCFYSERWKEIIGYSGSEIKYELDEWKKRVHPDDIERVLRVIGEHLNGATHYYQGEYRSLCANGSYKWILGRGKIMERNKDGKPIRVIGTIIDIDDRERTERELIEARILLKAAFEQSPIPMVMASVDNGVIKIVNAAAKELLGIDSEDEYIEKSIKDINKNWVEYNENGEEVNREELPLRRALKGLSTKSVEMVVERRDGTKRWESVSGAPIYDDEGKLISGMIVFPDITDKKELEIDLIDAKERAEEASKAKSLFLANMSHEIRTPLNGILGMAEILSMTALNKEQEKYINIMKTSGETLLNVINDILDISKIEAGKMEISENDFYINAFIEKVMDSFMIAVHTKGLELVYNIDSDVKNRLYGDEPRVKQVLTNLIGNSIKFTSSGEIFLSVSQLEESEESVKIKFLIRDTGIGIPKNKVNNIFDYFYQVDYTSTRKYGGTGLGLAISKKMVEMMNGEIGVVSEEGKGSEFYFTIPFKKKSEITVLEEIVGKDKNIIPENFKVLLITGNKSREILLEKKLNDFGCNVKILSDEKEVQKYLNDKNRYDLFIVDNFLKEGSGLRLLEEIKNLLQEDNKKITILATPMELSSLKKEMNNSGIRSFITKPIKLNELYELLKNNSIIDKTFENSELKNVDTKKSIKVLFAEDNIINQKTTKIMLEKEGMEVDIAENGEEAVEMFKNGMYDVLLMDIEMPVLNGIDASMRIRDTFKGKTIPIIALTAYAQRDDRKRCIDAGMNEYISKPYKAQELFDVVRRFAKK